MSDEAANYKAEDNRIPEIRAAAAVSMIDQIWAVLVDFGQLGEPGRQNQTTALEALERIDAILDSAPPAPRVFFFGDTVPGDVAVIDRFGQVRCHPEPWEIDNEFCRGYVEIGPVPYREEWLAAVDRASEERAIPEPTEGQNRDEN